jgi:hypothetical protein
MAREADRINTSPKRIGLTPPHPELELQLALDGGRLGAALRISTPPVFTGFEGALVVGLAQPPRTRA